MNDNMRVSLVIETGPFHDDKKTFDIELSSSLVEEVLKPLELSDEPMSLMLASPGLMGGYGNAYDIRNKTFKIRRSMAEELAKVLTDKLIEAFGVNDQLDGYRVSSMPEAQREYNRKRGKL